MSYRIQAKGAMWWGIVENTEGITPLSPKKPESSECEQIPQDLTARKCINAPKVPRWN